MKNKIKNLKLPKFKFTWGNKKSYNEGKGATILINAKFLVFLACSLISAFVNLIFIANLTKESYGIGALLSIPAAIVLGCISIGLDLSKCLHAIQVNTLNELYRKLSKFAWSSRVRTVSRRWFSAYILYVILSIITSVSLSSISIGSGITRNANTLKQIDEFISQGETYTDITSTAKNITMQSLIGKATDTSEQDAINFVNTQVSLVWPKVSEWQEEYTTFRNEGLNPNDYKSPEEGYKGAKSYGDYWVKRDREINTLLSSSKYSAGKVSEVAISRLTLAAFESSVKENYLKTYKKVSSEEATQKLNELTDTSMDEAFAWIETLNNLGLKRPSTNEIVIFDTNKEKQTKVLVASALTQLKALRVEVENDSGDIGSSSKIFMQIGSLFEKTKQDNNTDLTNVLDAKKTDTGSLGPTELMIMVMLSFLSLLCELAINQFSPKTNISRKLLSQFSQYFSADFNVNDFMLDVYIEQFNYGMMTEEQFNLAVEETLRSMRITKESLLERLNTPEPTKKTSRKEKVNISENIQPSMVEHPKEDSSKQDNGYSSNVTDAVKEIEELLK